MICRSLQALRFRVQHDGLLKTLAFVADACRPGEHQLFYLAGTSVGSPSISGSATILAGIEHLRSKRRPGLPECFYRDEIKGARRCYVALWRGELAGVMWVFDETYPSHFLDLGPNEVELGAGYVLEAFRRLGLLRSLVSAACSDLRDEGYCGFYAVVDARNVASRKAVEACGFKRVAKMSRPLSDLFGSKFRTQ